MFQMPRSMYSEDCREERTDITCYHCDQIGHIIRCCPRGKWAKGSYNAGSYSLYLIEVSMIALPQIKVTVDGWNANALVDIGCTSTLITKEMVDIWSTISLSRTSSINVIDGREIYSDIQMTVHGMQLTNLGDCTWFDCCLCQCGVRHWCYWLALQ